MPGDPADDNEVWRHPHSKTFGLAEAQRLLRSGHLLTRKNPLWHRRWIYLEREAIACSGEHDAVIVRTGDGLLPHVWAPTHADILAGDWCLHCFIPPGSRGGRWTEWELPDPGRDGRCWIGQLVGVLRDGKRVKRASSKDWKHSFVERRLTVDLGHVLLRATEVPPTSGDGYRELECWAISSDDILAQDWRVCE